MKNGSKDLMIVFIKYKLKLSIMRIKKLRKSDSLA